MPKKIHFTLLLITAVFFSACQPTAEQTAAPQAQAGVLQIGRWEFEQDGFLPLDGEWEFYWEALLTPEQIADENSPSPVYAPVPDDWTDYEFLEPLPESEGFATYRLEVDGLDSTQTYGIFLDGQNTAYQLWIDGRLAATLGQVGQSEPESVPFKVPTVVSFRPESSTAEFVLQVSNYHHRSSGFRNPILLHTDSAAHNYHLQLWARDILLVGILLIIGLYHIGLYFVNTKVSSPLLFALMCINSALRVSLTNQNIFLSTWPTLGWEFLLRVEYLTFFWSLPIFLLFLKQLYPSDVSKYALWIIYGIAGLFSFFVFFAETISLTLTANPYQMVFLAEAAYIMWVIGNILYKRRKGGSLIAFATASLFVASIIDILSNRGFLDWEEVTPYGFVLFIFVQAILIAWRFSEAFKLVETTKDELYQSEEKYRTIFEESRDLVFLLGEKAEIVDISPSCEQILGFTRREVQEMHIYDFVVHPPARELVAAVTQSSGIVRDLEIKVRRKNGSLFPGQVTAGWPYNPQGEVIGMQGMLRDLTDIKREQDLSQAKEIAEAENRAKSTFLANMSHEIRTPLNTILGYTEMLQESPAITENREDLTDLKRIHSAGNHLLHLINDILDLSKVEAGKMPLHLTTFPIYHTILEVTIQAQPLMSQNNNTLVRG